MKDFISDIKNLRKDRENLNEELQKYRFYRIFYFLLILLVTVGVGRSLYSTIHFNKNCVETVGYINGEITYRDHMYNVYYTFDFKGENYIGLDNVSNEPLKKEVSVLFLKDDPNTNKLEKRSILTSSFFFIFSCIFLVGTTIWAFQKNIKSS